MTLAGCANAAGAEDLPTVTPYRPSVSVPAALSAPGWLEVEAGLQSGRADDPRRRDSLPYSLKLAFSPDWGIRVSGDAVVHLQPADGSSVQGGGDTAFVLKRRFAVDDASAFGLELGVKLATARRGLGSGYQDVGLEGIYSSDFAPKWHVDLNASVTQLGGPRSGTGVWQQAWAAAVSRNLSDRVGVSAELSGTQLAGASRTAQALVASSYLVSRAASLDFGLSKGLTAASGGGPCSRGSLSSRRACSDDARLLAGEQRLVEMRHPRHAAREAHFAELVQHGAGGRRHPLMANRHAQHRMLAVLHLVQPWARPRA